jgi:BMFP domain-containing protein YqiC
VWQNDDGVVTKPAAIVGSIQQQLKVLKVQLDRVSTLDVSMREELTIVGQELVKKKQELEDLDAGMEAPPG